MTTLPNRPHAALLVIDVQQGVVDHAYQRDTTVAHIGDLVTKARQAGAPVIWVLQSDEELVRGSQQWQLVPELSRGDNEPLIDKSYADAFEQTDLEAVLARLGVGQLLVAGAQTDACVRATLHGALVRGYDATLVSDAHTTEDNTSWGAPPPEMVIAHTNLYWTYEVAPGRKGGTLTTEEVDFSAL